MRAHTCMCTHPHTVDHMYAQAQLAHNPHVPDLPECNYGANQGASVCGTTFQKAALFINMSFH